MQHDAIICDFLAGRIYKNRLAAAAIDRAIAAGRVDQVVLVEQLKCSCVFAAAASAAAIAVAAAT